MNCFQRNVFRRVLDFSTRIIGPLRRPTMGFQEDLEGHQQSFTRSFWETRRTCGGSVKLSHLTFVDSPRIMQNVTGFFKAVTQMLKKALQGFQGAWCLFNNGYDLQEFLKVSFLVVVSVCHQVFPRVSGRFQGNFSQVKKCEVVLLCSCLCVSEISDIL